MEKGTRKKGEGGGINRAANRNKTCLWDRTCVCSGGRTTVTAHTVEKLREKASQASETPEGGLSDFSPGTRAGEREIDVKHYPSKEIRIAKWLNSTEG